MLRTAVLAAGVVAALSVPARAQYNVKQYRELAAGVDRQDHASITILYAFALGMWNAVEATNAAYVRAGAKPRICLPAKEGKAFLIDAIDEELSRNAAFWADKEGVDLGYVAIRGLREKYPCK